MPKTALSTLGLLFLAVGLGMRALSQSTSETMHFVEGFLVGMGAALLIGALITRRQGKE